MGTTILTFTRWPLNKEGWWQHSQFLRCLIKRYEILSIQCSMHSSPPTSGSCWHGGWNSELNIGFWNLNVSLNLLLSWWKVSRHLEICPGGEWFYWNLQVASCFCCFSLTYSLFFYHLFQLLVCSFITCPGGGWLYWNLQVGSCFFVCFSLTNSLLIWFN